MILCQPLGLSELRVFLIKLLGKNFLVVQWLGLHTSLVKELRSCMASRMALPSPQNALDNGTYPTEWLPRLNNIIHAIHTAQCIHSENHSVMSDS